jgi:hypothetical protein
MTPWLFILFLQCGDTHSLVQTEYATYKECQAADAKAHERTDCYTASICLPKEQKQ